MTLKLYNTLTRQKEEFVPINPGKVGMYACGFTVYDYAHLGSAKAYVNHDTLRRSLEYLGYEVRFIENVTDVGHLTNDDLSQGDTGEDKLIKKAAKEHKTPQEIALFYEDYFHSMEKSLNILPAHFYPRATAHIPQMIRLIEKLITNGHAYESNGNVFYDVQSFEKYGELSGNAIEKLRVGARLEEEHPDKRHQYDFALWLKAPENHIMKWPSPWSVGYPGWHIECSAMSTEYLSETFDIHAGGEDHIFPHHEAEIAQTEGATNKPFARYWIHERHLLVDGAKMSKSKGHAVDFRLENITAKGYSPMDIRMLLLSSHYRSQTNFTWGSLDQAKKNRERIEKFIQRINAYQPNIEESSPEVAETIKVLETNFIQAIEDDINTPLALSHLYECISQFNGIIDKDTLSGDDQKTFLDLWKRINHVFGLVINDQIESEQIPAEVLELVEKRKQARAEKNFELSDNLRNEIQSKGYSVEDTKDGQVTRKI